MTLPRPAALAYRRSRKTVPKTDAVSQAGSQPRGLRGFTLVEVLVALAIVAVALAAGVRATASLSRNAERQSDLLQAHLCAENALVNIRLSRQMPAVGDNTTSCEQGGRTLAVRLTVQPTPNPNFLRTEAQVFDGNVRLLNLSTVVGRY